ncbi:MAG: hypothetical protein ACE366_22870 [Bradymonadia bacterium]
MSKAETITRLRDELTRVREVASRLPDDMPITRSSMMCRARELKSEIDAMYQEEHILLVSEPVAAFEFCQ